MLPASDDLEQRLGRNLRARRIEAGLSQVELAERANVSLGALRNLERGAGSSTSTLTRVLRGLGAEAWLDAVAPVPTPFNPLEVLRDRERAQRRASGPPRVRRSRPPSAP